MTNVISILETAPALIAAKGVELVQKRKALDTAKHNLEVARAAATIQHQDAKNQKLLEAYVANDAEVRKMEIAQSCSARLLSILTQS